MPCGRASERREMLSRLEAKLRINAAGRPQRRLPHSSTHRPKAWQARSCNHISRSWPAIKMPALFPPAAKLPSATTHLIRSGFRLRLT